MVDGREGINPLDQEVELLRRNNKNAIIAINKLDIVSEEYNSFDFLVLLNLIV